MPTLDERPIRFRASCKCDDRQAMAVFSDGVEGAIDRVIGFVPG